MYDLKLKKRTLPCKFTGISELGGKALALKLPFGTTLTNLKGKILVKPASFSIEKISSDYSIVNFQGQYGIIDSRGFAVIEPRFKSSEDSFHELLLMLTDNYAGKNFSIRGNTFAQIQRSLRQSLTGAEMDVIPFEDKTYVAVKEQGLRRDLGNGSLQFRCS